MPLKINQVSLPKDKIANFVFIFFVISRIIALFFSFPCITDVTQYLEWSNKIHLGLFPYSQFNFEYPPLTIIPIYLPSFLAKNNFESYYVAFAFLMFAIDFCCLKLCQNYCKTRLTMSSKEISYMTMIYSLFGLLLFRILYHRLDLIVALFLVMSLLFFRAQTSKITKQFFINGLAGFFYKVIPIFIIPSAIIIKAFTDSSFCLKKIIKKIFCDSLIFFTSLVAIIWALEIFTNHHFIENMLFHQNRGIQIESSFGSLLLMKNLLFSADHSEIYNGFGSWNILGSNYLEFIAKILGFLVLGYFYASLFFIFFFKKIRSNKIQFSEKQFLELTLITLLIILAFQRVLSTQFFIWLIPIAAIWLAKNRSPKFLIIFSFLFFASFFIFSIDYFSLVGEVPIMVAILFLRNCILVIFTLWLMINFLKNLKNEAN